MGINKETIQDIKDWNTAYGLKPSKLKNLVWGIIVMLSATCGWLVREVIHLSDLRVSDAKESYQKLYDERVKQDSINNMFRIKYYELKSSK